MRSTKLRVCIIVLITICFSVSPLFSAAAAVLTNIQGKVEIKPVNGSWVAASEGMKIGLMDTISTGFNSTADLRLEDNIVQVSPLTRLTLDKLLEQNGKLSTNLYLKVGKVTADVKSSKGLAQDFKVQSPYSTASVRGTKLVFDGVSLRVIEGNVRFELGKPKRDFSQYVNQMLEEQYGETLEETPEGTPEGTPVTMVEAFTLDMDALPEEEVMAFLNDVVGELVQSGEIDQDEAGDLVTNLAETVIGQPAEDGATPPTTPARTEGVDVPAGKEVKLKALEVQMLDPVTEKPVPVIVPRPRTKGDINVKLEEKK